MADLKFACPRCRADLNSTFVCNSCKLTFESHDGIYHFLLPEQEAELQPFLSQYRHVRAQDGNAGRSPEYYRMLPYLPIHDPDIERWHIRRRSFESLLALLPAPPLRILDLGAG